MQAEFRSVSNGGGDALLETAPEAPPRGIFKVLRRMKKDKSNDGDAGSSVSIMQRAHSVGPASSKRSSSAQQPPPSDVLNGFVPRASNGGAYGSIQRPVSAFAASGVSSGEGPDGDQPIEEGLIGRRNKGFSWKNPFSAGTDTSTAAPATLTGGIEPCCNFCHHRHPLVKEYTATSR